MIHCINCIWAFGCLDLDTDDYLNQQLKNLEAGLEAIKNLQKELGLE